MLDVIITTNPYDESEYSLHQTDSLTDLLQKQFPVWPEHARIYLNDVAESCDITPKCNKDIDRLKALDTGKVYVVVYPGDPITIIIAVVAVAVLAAAAFLFLKPKTPDLGSTASPNNSLSDRSNSARLNSRIPDIYGQVRSVPDLLAVPYRIFENNVEIEIAYMCVGRGSYEIDDARDGDTLIGSIAGAGATFYGPNTSPNFGAPQLQIGSAITQDLYSVVKLNEANGQTLIPPNSNAVKGNSNIKFVPPNVIKNNGFVDFTQKFDAGQTITVGTASFGGSSSYTAINEIARFYADKTVEFQSFDPSTVFEVGNQVTMNGAIFTDGITIDLSGTYIIAVVTSTTIEFE
jgi:hypothetical protein